MRWRQKLVALNNIDALLIEVKIVMSFGFLNPVFTTGALSRHVLDVLVRGLIKDLLLNLDRFLVVADVVD